MYEVSCLDFYDYCNAMSVDVAYKLDDKRKEEELEYVLSFMISSFAEDNPLSCFDHSAERSEQALLDMYKDELECKKSIPRLSGLMERICEHNLMVIATASELYYALHYACDNKEDDFYPLHEFQGQYDCDLTSEYMLTIDEYIIAVLSRNGKALILDENPYTEIYASYCDEHPMIDGDEFSYVINDCQRLLFPEMKRSNFLDAYKVMEHATGIDYAPIGTVYALEG